MRRFYRGLIIGVICLMRRDNVVAPVEEVHAVTGHLHSLALLEINSQQPIVTTCRTPILLTKNTPPLGRLRSLNQCSYLVLTFPSGDPRTLRLYDMKPRDVLTVQCSWGHIGRFAAGELQRKSRRVFSDMPIWDLQHRLRCQHCRRTKGMRIIL